MSGNSRQCKLCWVFEKGKVLNYVEHRVQRASQAHTHRNQTKETISALKSVLSQR